MAHYLVHATPKPHKIAKLASQLDADAFSHLEPFGQALTSSLRGARVEPGGEAIWEEEDYCSPPLAMERDAVLDDYFDRIRVERVAQGEGWRQIEALPHLFPGLQARRARDAAPTVGSSSA